MILSLPLYPPVMCQSLARRSIKTTMNKRKDQQAAVVEEAGMTGEPGRSGRAKSGAAARRQPRAARGAVGKRRLEERPEAEAQGKAVHGMRQSLDEAMLVWQIQYLECWATKQGLLKAWREARQEPARGDEGTPG